MWQPSFLKVRVIIHWPEKNKVTFSSVQRSTNIIRPGPLSPTLSTKTPWRRRWRPTRAWWTSRPESRSPPWRSCAGSAATPSVTSLSTMDLTARDHDSEYSAILWNLLPSNNNWRSMFAKFPIFLGVYCIKQCQWWCQSLKDIDMWG